MKTKRVIPSVPKNISRRNHTWVGLAGASGRLAIFEYLRGASSPAIILCDREALAAQTAAELRFFSGQDDFALYVPDTETLPYDLESPHAALMSERARAFHKLASFAGDKSPDMRIVTSVPTVMRRISPKQHWVRQQAISVGAHFDREAVASNLLAMGYQSELLDISTPGQFAFRNEILDIYPVGDTRPYRVRFSAGAVDAIDVFSLNSQRSIAPAQSLLALSAREMPVDAEAVDLFKANYRRAFDCGYGDEIYDRVLKGDLPAGIEYLSPLFQKELVPFLDYLPAEAGLLVFALGDIEKASERHWDGIQGRAEDVGSDQTRRILDPTMLWLNPNDLKASLAARHVITILAEQSDAPSDIDCSAVPTGMQRQKDLHTTLAALTPILNKSKKVMLSLTSDVRREQFVSIAEVLGETPVDSTSWLTVIESSEKTHAVISPIEDGCFIESTQTLILPEKEVFGQPIAAKSEGDMELSAVDLTTHDLQSLQVDDPIVHLGFGVGRYDGLTVTSTEGVDREYLVIRYAKDLKAYVRMDDLHLVSRYGGIDADSAPLDEMRSEKWVAGLAETAASVESAARSLIEAKKFRALRERKKFAPPGYLFQKFCLAFPFQETADQKKAVLDIIADMTSSRPMDRMVVGDVGFGKTEVAMRAAFLAAADGCQVAVLVPTTLLAQQHYENFKNRFAGFPLEIAILSRFDKSSEVETLSAIKSGTASIVIGTHKLIQPDVEFKNLGLLVIDEEHRFGVRQKELFRSMRSDLDVLSLTATPIPRTLSMSLQGVKDLSLIATAPAKRLSIRTLVRPGDTELVKEAVQREMMRNGQVFVLHNAIETIDARASEIVAAVPGVRVKVGHGRMNEADLAEVMAAFYRHEFDVLVCTTIIETGIDIPNANTILIDDANKLGLSQLHQLRGRVGRSNRQAYAYLLRGHGPSSRSADLRLKAMEQASSLGEGFVLASHDLEIRGAGEVLGEEQSGQIQSVGFVLYMRLLERAMKKLERDEEIDDLLGARSELVLEINSSGLIDANYISHDQSRLSIYKRLAAAEKARTVTEIEEEMLDRYGPLPSVTKHLVLVAKLRTFLRQACVRKVVASAEDGVLEIWPHGSISGRALVNLIHEDLVRFKLTAPHMIQFKHTAQDKEERLRFLGDLIKRLWWLTVGPDS